MPTLPSVQTPLSAEEMPEAVEPADMATPLVRRKRLSWDLLLRCREVGFETRPLGVGCAAPSEQRPRLVGRETPAGQRPAMEVLLQFLGRVLLGSLRHGTDAAAK